MLEQHVAQLASADPYNEQTACLCNAAANQRVLRGMQSSCSGDSGEDFEGEVDDVRY